MADGLKKLIQSHYDKTKEGEFERVMCAFALEMIEWKSKQWKRTMFIIAIVIVPIILVLIDKFGG